MVKHPEQRVGVLVDVANLYHSARNLYSKKVNFRKVLATVVADRKLIRASAYVVRSDNNEDEVAFFEALSQQGFEVVMKDLQTFAGGAKKGDWDVGIRLDVIVLVSGDGDYVPLVNYIQSTTGCLVEVAAFRQTASSKLMEIADDFISLSDRQFLINR